MNYNLKIVKYDLTTKNVLVHMQLYFMRTMNIHPIL